MIKHSKEEYMKEWRAKNNDRLKEYSDKYNKS